MLGSLIRHVLIYLFLEAKEWQTNTASLAYLYILCHYTLKHIYTKFVSHRIKLISLNAKCPMKT